jgi:23S rRNA pseudouridine1911/1915/1917 synthase
VRYVVPAEAAGLSLGKYLYDRLKLSRNLIRKAKNSEGLFVNGQMAYTNQLLAGGEVVELVLAVAGRVAPEPVPLAVIYEDEYLLVVDKPPFMVVHPVKDYVGGTLANGVAYHLQQQGVEPVVRPIQRIDRDTTGLVLFAKDPAVAGSLARELDKHKLDRHYVAFVHGRPAEEAGTVNLPIRRVWGHPVAREVAVGPRTLEQEALLSEAVARGVVLRAEWMATGQAAVTHWTVMRRWSTVSMLALQLETGRTHQIRVHMANLGHPILADQLYGRSGEAPGHQALHAASLAFTHPVTGEPLRFEAPLPGDLSQLISQLDQAQ